ncbi:MAG TPA: AraC family transcriptional regulator [Mucilaginibacter sp.]|jgi:AraC-like DNA-binding protein
MVHLNSRETIINSNNTILDKVVKTLQLSLTAGFPGIQRLSVNHYISPTKLKKDFKARFNMTIFSYYRSLQMEMADKLLKEGKYTYKQLTVLFNFSSQYNFSICYKKYLHQKENSMLFIKVLTDKETYNKELFDIFKEASEIGHIGAWKFNFDNETFLCNEVFRNILEVSDRFEPTIEMFLAFFMGKENHELVSSAFQNALLGGLSFDIECNISSTAGITKRVRLTGQPDFRKGICHKLSGIFQEVFNH